MRLLRNLTMIALCFLLAGCSAPQAGPTSIYVDGTRGCKQDPAPVALWSAPGAAAVGAHVVAEAPHGLALAVAASETVYGIRFYRVAYQGQDAWLPANFAETIPPVCD